MGIAAGAGRYNDPVQVQTEDGELKNIVSIAAGTSFSLAMDINGKVYAFGRYGGQNVNTATELNVDPSYAIGAFHDSASIVTMIGEVYRWDTVSGHCCR